MKNKIIDTLYHKKLFEKLQRYVKFDNDEKGFILDTKEEKHLELKKYFKFNSSHQANMALKIWIKELENENIEDESDEDSMIKFFQIKYFITAKDRLVEEGTTLKGLGENL